MNPSDPSEPDERFLQLLSACDDALATGECSSAQSFEMLPANQQKELRGALACLERLEREWPRFELAATPPPSAPGIVRPRRLGRFVLYQHLGSGGFGTVFLATDPTLSRKVALKLPRLEVSLQPELRRRFLTEARAAAGLDHPHIVPVFEAGEIDSVCYIASLYIEGPNLAEWLKTQAPELPPPRAAALLVAQLAEAVTYVHDRGIVHRDLKPSNILLQRGERRKERGEDQKPQLPQPDGAFATDYCLLTTVYSPRITDFGLARLQETQHGGTRTGVSFGTPAYMPPEQALGRWSEVGPPADIYALGAILYELLTGQPPFKGASDLDIQVKVINEKPLPPRRLNRSVPGDLEIICLKCLEKDPALRYRDAVSFGDDLRRFLDGRPIQARPVGRPVRVAKWIRRRPEAAALGGTILVLLMALVSVALWIVTRSPGENRAAENNSNSPVLESEQDWRMRNLQYATQIRAGKLLQADSQFVTLRDVLDGLKPGPGQHDVRGFEWHYLWRDSQRAFHPAHPSHVSALAYSQNGEMLASGSQDGTIHLYARHSGKLLSKLKEHDYHISTLNFLNDDTRLLSTAFEKTSDGKGFRGEFILWSLRGESKIWQRRAFIHHSPDDYPIFSLARSARILFAIDHESDCDRVLAFDLDNGTEREILREKHLFSIAASPDADRIALVHHGVAAEQGTWRLNLVDLATNRRISTMARDNTFLSAAISPDGKSLALGMATKGSPYCVQLRDLPDLHYRNTLDWHFSPWQMSYDWPGNRLCVFTRDNGVHFYDAHSSKWLGEYSDPGISHMTFSPDGEEMAGGRTNGHVFTGKYLSAPPDGSLLAPLPKSEAWCAAFSTDGSSLAAGYDHEFGQDKQTLQLWDLSNKKQARVFSGHDATVMAVAMSPDGKTLASASFDRTVRLWDVAKGKCIHELKGHTDAVRALAFSPDGQRLVSGSEQSIRVWIVADGSQQNSWRGHDDIIRSLAFSPDGKYLISAANDKTIKVWNGLGGSLLHVIENDSVVQCIACSPEGNLVASGNQNNKVELWELSTGALVKTMRGHNGKVRTVAFSTDGKTLASGGEDKTVRLWNVVSGEELLVLPTTDYVNGLAFNARRPILAAALHDGTIKLWSAE